MTFATRVRCRADCNSRQTPLVVALVIATSSGVAVALLDVGPSLLAVLVIGAVAWMASTRGSARLRVVAAGMLFLGTFGVVYVLWVAPAYSYSGSEFVSSDGVTLAIMSAIGALPLAWLPAAARKPSDVVVWLLYASAYVPAVMVPILATGDLGQYWPLMLVLLGGMLTVSVLAEVPATRLALRGLDAGTWVILLCALAIGIDVYLLAAFGLPKSIPGLASVYDTRLAFRDAASTVGGPAGYVVTWSVKVFAPLLLAIGLARHSWVPAVVAVATVMLVYAHDGEKAALVGLGLVAGVYLLVRFRRPTFGANLIAAFAGVIVVATAVTLFTGDPWGLALVPQRMFAVPGVLTRRYFDFFASNPVYELRHSILAFLGPPPFELQPARLIGLTYYGSSATNANANIWADGIANFSLPGALFMSGVVGLALAVLNGVCTGRDPIVTIPAVATVGLTLANGAALTSLVTGGLILLIALLALMPPLQTDEAPARSRRGRGDRHFATETSTAGA